MKITPWFPGTTSPVRAGQYERDYSNTPIGGTAIDLWLQYEKGRGFWYVREPHGQINDAYYECLPWRGIKKRIVKQEAA